MPSRSWEEARNDFHHDLISNFNQTLPESLMHSGKLGIVEFACGMIPVPVQHSVPLHCRGWDLLEGRLNRRRICQNLSKIISEFKVFVEAEELVKLIFNKRLSFTDFGFCQDLAETADKSDCNVPKKKKGRAKTAQNLSPACEQRAGKNRLCEKPSESLVSAGWNSMIKYKRELVWACTTSPYHPWKLDSGFKSIEVEAVESACDSWHTTTYRIKFLV